MKKQVKLMAVAVTMLVGVMANAQITSTTDTNLNKKTGAAAADGAVIRLIDNKGTIKYLQSRNGITQITSTNTGNETVTTWQLGGTLDAHTYIAADANNTTVADRKVFALDGIKLVQPGTTTNALVGISGGGNYSAATSATATDGSSHRAVITTGADAGLTASTATQNGFTVLIRNEVTGAIEKMLLADLLNVEDAHDIVTVTAASIANLTDNNATNTNGISLGFETSNIRNVQVYRNGAKLRANIDYGIKTYTPTAPSLPYSIVYLVRTPDNYYASPSVTPTGNNPLGTALSVTHVKPNDWRLLVNDVIEVHAKR